MISIIFGLIASLAFGYFISRSIAKPIQEIATIADDIAIGDINHEININRKDEVGILANSFRTLIVYMKDLANVADSIAHNDLTVTVDVKSEADALGNSFSTMVTNLKQVIQKLTISATEVASAATEISSSSEQVAKNAQNQDQQIAQITTAVEEMSATIVESAQNAGEATKVHNQQQKQQVTVVRLSVKLLKV